MRLWRSFNVFFIVTSRNSLWSTWHTFLRLFHWSISLQASQKSVVVKQLVSLLWLPKRKCHYIPLSISSSTDFHQTVPPHESWTRVKMTAYSWLVQSSWSISPITPELQLVKPQSRWSSKECHPAVRFVYLLLNDTWSPIQWNI